jgi:hypothetical protein
MSALWPFLISDRCHAERTESSLTRSRADIAPHTPCVSRIDRACSRHCSSTGHCRQIRLARSSRARIAFIDVLPRLAPVSTRMAARTRHRLAVNAAARLDYRKEISLRLTLETAGHHSTLGTCPRTRRNGAHAVRRYRKDRDRK